MATTTSFTHNSLLSTSNLFNHCQLNNRICKFNKIITNPNQYQYSTRVRAIKDKTEQVTSPDEVTQKYGIEAGLWKVTPQFYHLHTCFIVYRPFLVVCNFPLAKHLLVQVAS